MANFLDVYQKVTGFPFGHRLFNMGIGLKAPFFGKIRPNVIDLKRGLCVVEIKDRWGIRNHIGTINAGALCTLAELSGGLACDASIPARLRWIPKGMSVSYLKKAKGTLKAVCEIDPESIREGDFIIPVTVHDRENETVFAAEITFYISARKS